MSEAIIVGAGVSGLTSAIALRDAGMTVTLIDRQAIGRESSWAGAGILSPLPPWGYGPELTRLATLSLSLWPDWINKLTAGPDPEYWRCGMLVLDVEDPQAAQAWLADHSHSAPPAAVQALMQPSAAWLPEVAQARNPRLLQSLLQHARAIGVELIEHCGVDDWEINATRVTALHTPHGRMTADYFVAAAGAWSLEALGDLAAGMEVFPVRGQILLLQSQPGVVPCVILRNGHYLVPRRDGLVLVGSTLEPAGFDKTPTAEARTDLFAFARETIPALAQATVVNHWAGLRPGSPGNIPTIGRHPALENLYANCGHFRYGVTLAPAAATLLADQILARPSPIPTTPYAWPEKSSRAAPDPA